MLRRCRPCLILPLAIGLAGCKTDELPSVPPPPKEGTVQPAPASPGVITPEMKSKIGGRRGTPKTASPPTAN